MSAVNKPVMRRLLHNQIKKNIIVAVCLSAVAGYAYKVFVGDARKKAYRDFYKTYDIDKEFEEMKSKGLFDSCPDD